MEESTGIVLRKSQEEIPKETLEEFLKKIIGRFSIQILGGIPRVILKLNFMFKRNSWIFPRRTFFSESILKERRRNSWENF